MAKEYEKIEREKQKIDQLLLNVLPAQTANELKKKGKAVPCKFERVSILFADIAKFTTIAEKLSPTELVEQLDAYFSAIDSILDKYNIEKIKTMGDAYLCAGGVPVKNRTNPVDAVLAGLEIQQAMKRRNHENSNPWEMRVGIHTGKVVAGVIGNKKIAYDLWGDTVNIAKRMEGKSELGKVNISIRTFLHIEPYFDCTYRGRIKAKNKGEVDMYYVDRIKPGLSIDANGETPTPLFWELVEKHTKTTPEFEKAKKYVYGLMQEKLSPQLLYHTVQHTKDVVLATEKIALAEKVNENDMMLLRTAALYHDLSFIEQYDDNEPLSADHAQKTLPEFGYKQEEIDKIKELILVTKVPHQSETKLEKIICDADLDYLGRDDFFPLSDNLREELKAVGKIKTNEEWDNIQLKFFEQHRYFTDYSIKHRKDKKWKHFEQIKDKLRG